MNREHSPGKIHRMLVKVSLLQGIKAESLQSLKMIRFETGKIEGR